MTLTSPFIDLSFSFYFLVQIDWAQIPLEERKRLRREAARHAKKKETKGIGNEAAEPVGLADADPVVAAFPMGAAVHRLARIVGGNVEADVEAACRE